MYLKTLHSLKTSIAIKTTAGLIFTAISLCSHAQDGALDHSFSGNGIAVTSLSGHTSQIYSTCLLADGKIIAGGAAYDGTGYDFVLAKYKTNGTLDSAFGTNGVVITDIGSTQDVCYAVAVQPDGKIIAAGTAGATRTLVRYTAVGQLDNDFGFNGVVQSGEGIAVAVAVKTTGKIIVAVEAQGLGCAQYNGDGSIDVNFGLFFGNSYVTNNPTEYTLSMYLLPNGDALVAGSFQDINGKSGTAIAKFKNDGTPDNTFGVSGLSEITYAVAGNSVKVNSTGKILVGGVYYYQDLDHKKFGLARFNANGIPDSTFGTNGVVVTSIVPDGHGFIENDFNTSMVIQKNDKIVVAGTSTAASNSHSTIALAKYNANGVLDAGFGNGGIVVTPVASYANATTLLLQADGRLVAAGASGTSTAADFTLVRYIDDDALPVTLLNFTAAKNGKGIVLNWQTATELNSNYFAVERSCNGTSFSEIGRVKSMGTSNTLQQYNFFDATSTQGKNYYRLKQVDVNGAYAYSKIAVVDVNGSITISAYPNPVTDNLFIQGLNPAIKSIISLTDINGRVISAATVSASNYYFNIKNLAAGYYLVKIQAGKKVTVVKVLKN